ncbi:unnamed protein product [Zymoseptoria tritici ST99CH_3D1]|nr:unnamed protein product [Zymoseptoria tritici ST99CH_3D1]
MAPMDDALDELRAAKVKNIAEIATRHGVHRSTLSRQYRKVNDSRARRDENNMILSHQQERTLVGYIDTLIRRGIPPTPAMVRTFAEDISKHLPSRQWISAFVGRYADINSKYLNLLDKNRKQADSVHQYQSYYDLLEEKLKKYNIKTCNTYNMDEKGFMVGMLQKSRRIFTKEHWMSKAFIGHM